MTRSLEEINREIAETKERVCKLLNITTEPNKKPLKELELEVQSIFARFSYNNFDKLIVRHRPNFIYGEVIECRFVLKTGDLLNGDITNELKKIGLRPLVIGTYYVWIGKDIII